MSNLNRVKIYRLATQIKDSLANIQGEPILIDLRTETRWLNEILDELENE